mgnify:CR=1 FL=1
MSSLLLLLLLLLLFLGELSQERFKFVFVLLFYIEAVFKHQGEVGQFVFFFWGFRVLGTVVDMRWVCVITPWFSRSRLS